MHDKARKFDCRAMKTHFGVETEISPFELSASKELRRKGEDLYNFYKSTVSLGRPCDWCGLSVREKGRVFLHLECQTKEADALMDVLY